MSVAQPLFAPTDPPFGAVVARQISVWPFAARMQRLFLLVDPSAPSGSLREGIVRAMQQAYFRSDGQSQTRCVREAALAAHYVLSHHNRDALPFDQVCAAAAVVAIRGQVAFAALTGDGSVFAWRNGRLSGLHGAVRLARPLGLEADPRIALWSSALEPGDRLVLVCGAEGRRDAPDILREVLSQERPAEETEQLAAEALGSNRPVGVLIVEPSRRHLRLLPPLSPAEQASAPSASIGPTELPRTPSRRRLSVGRALATLAGVALFAGLAFGAFATSTVPSAPVAHVTNQSAGRVVAVHPEIAVRFGPAGGNVLDLAVGDDALYTLDVVENSVRLFALDGRDQQPLPDTLLARAGTPVGNRGLARPIAIAYAGGALTIVDSDRGVFAIGRDRRLTPATPSSTSTWNELGALGADVGAHLFVLDSGAQRLLDYALQNGRLVDPPRVALEHSSLALPWTRIVDLVALGDSTLLRLDDGTLRRFDRRGADVGFQVQAPDRRPPAIAGLAPDRAGGLYLADAANGRILQTTAEGEYLRELRHPALGGLRELKSSANGRRLYGLVASGVLAFDVPDADSGN